MPANFENSSGYRTRKGHFSFQFQRRAMPKNIQTIVQLHSFHMLARIHRRATHTQKKKNLNDPDNHSGVITHLELDILECEVKWALGSITMNKGSGGDGIPVELFQILKDDDMKVLHSICQQIWKTQ